MAIKFRNLVPLAKCKKHGVNPLIMKGQKAKDWVAKHASPDFKIYAPYIDVLIVCPICKIISGYTEGYPDAMRAALDRWNNSQL